MLAKFLLLFFVFSFLFRTDLSFDQDLGRHIKLGEIIWQTREVPKTNLFSYTNPDFPFINTHWLFEMVAFLFQQAGALQLFLILKIIIIIVSVWMKLKIIPKQNTALLLPVGFIFLHVLRERIELRPEIFSFLFTATTYYILEKRNKLLFVLPLIQLIWINMHIYFFVGLLLQMIFLIYLFLKRTGAKLDHPPGGLRWHLLLICLCLSVIVSLLNPNGLSGLLYPLNVTKNYGYTIVENQTIFLLESINFRNPNFLFVKISAGIVGLSLIITLVRRNFDIRNILLAASGVVLALMHVRSFPYLVFLSLPAVMQNFGTVPCNKMTKTFIFMAAILLILESYFYLNGDYYKFRDDQHKVGLGFEEHVKGGMNFVLSNDLPQPIYNNFDIGSYILYRGYPKYKVFVDGRPEAYPAQFFTGVYIPSQADYANFKKAEEIYGFKTIIFSHTDQTPWGRNFLQNVVKDPDWDLVYIDDFVVVLTKVDLSSVDLSKLTPDTFKFDNHLAYLRLGLFLATTGNNESASQFIRKTLQIFPDSPIANAVFGNTDKAKSVFFW